MPRIATGAAATSEEFAADIDKEEAKWGGLVRKLGLKAD